MRLIIAFIFTLLGLTVALINSAEAPVRIGENNGVKFVAIVNLAWLIPYSINYIKKNKNIELAKTFLTYMILLTPFVFMRLYATPFNSQKWKTQMDKSKTYMQYPAHANGAMVENIIEGKILIGLTRQEIEDMLGSNYFTQNHMKDSNICYYYSSKNIFEGCNKLLIHFNNNVCSEANYAGCD